jgi:hypothetical protein
MSRNAGLNAGWFCRLLGGIEGYVVSAVEVASEF